MADVKLWVLNSNAWNHFSECKKSSSSFKNIIYKMCLQIIYIFNIYIYKQRLAVITYNGWYGLKPNWNKSYMFNIYV